MRRKALISGVLPSPFEGPWIPVGGDEWKYIPNIDFEGKVAIEVRKDGSSSRHLLNGKGFTFEGDTARAVVLESMDTLSCVTVNIHAGD